MRYSRGLNKFRGPFLASFTDFWKLQYALAGIQKPIYVDVHEKYGDIVRIGPNELSFADPQAIRDIYGPRGCSQKVRKDFIKPKPAEIISSQKNTLYRPPLLKENYSKFCSLA
jgi:hypothetical protein